VEDALSTLVCRLAQEPRCLGPADIAEVIRGLQESESELKPVATSFDRAIAFIAGVGVRSDIQKELRTAGLLGTVWRLVEGN
jgi:hypothetical protein